MIIGCDEAVHDFLSFFSTVFMGLHPNVTMVIKTDLSLGHVIFIIFKAEMWAFISG